MIILQAKGLTKHFGIDKIFEDINFVIQEGEKIGLVGPNGAGKTTLFRCLTGEEQLDSGEIMVSDRFTLGYLEQMPEYSLGTTLFDVLIEMFTDVLALRDKMRSLEKAMGNVSDKELQQIMNQYSRITEQYEQAGGFGCEAHIRKIISGLGFLESDLNKDINSFSGGEKTRASLARLLVREPDIMLLDEPTNHLDLQAVEWLETYLKGYKGTVLLVSHDRYFLDKVSIRTLELEHGELNSFPGNYSRYLVLKEEKTIAQMKAYQKQQKEIKATEEYINKYRAGIKSKQARGRQSQLNRLERIEAPKESLSVNLNWNGQEVESTGNIVLAIKDLSFGFNNEKLLDRINIEIGKGEKVALIGGNGTGKSTLIKLIIGEYLSSEGKIDLGSRLKIGYYDQHHSGLNINNRVIDEIMHGFSMSETQARNYLGSFLFQGDDVFKVVKDLSGGEKGRLSLLKILLTQPNFLILDEPTNHLDISSKEIIEDFLQDFSGTILMVSHDRYFLDKIITRTLELSNKKIENYLGNYSYYKEKNQEKLKHQFELENKKEKNELKNKEVEKPKINKAKTRQKIAELEKEIEQMEFRLEELSQILADSVTYQDEEQARDFVQEYKLLEVKIPETYKEWETLLELISQ